MADKKTDIWTTEKYDNAASFVPRMVSKVVGWLDVQKDDVILDIGCDGILDMQFAETLAQGTGRVHGVDSSPSMIATSQASAAKAGRTNATFEVYDCNDLVDRPALQTGAFNKVFSSAAMHWILADRAKHEQFFRGVHAALQPGGVFVFETGGLGNVTELVTAIVSSTSRRIGLEAAKRSNPWFFPDEDWVRDILERRVGGWAIEKMEREWRETPASSGGIDGWIRLMARPLLDAVPEAEREACTQEIINVLEYTTRTPKGAYVLQYVRLRVVARRL